MSRVAVRSVIVFVRATPRRRSTATELPGGDETTKFANFVAPDHRLGSEVRLPPDFREQVPEDRVR